ncbi:MAG TPA: pitrilysin family protein, partial [Bacteroidota bacterium]|nr:pitrilysin family protein [Bacteroidota bacterium]
MNVGSRDENETNNGISHFLEHMVFKGTKHNTAKQIARSLESVGGYLNAFTSKEHTCFYARILDDQLPKAVDVISELVQCPIFDKKEIEKEKQVVLEELKNLEDDPDDLIHDYFDSHIYHKHPLGYPVIGKAENIKSFTKGKLRDYIRRHYVPDRMVVAAAGNCKHEEVVELVERYFHGNRHNGTIKRESVSHRQRQTKEVYEKPIMQAHVCMGTRSFSIKNRMRYPLLVLNTLLGEGMSSRLFQNIREKYGFAYSIYSFANLLSDAGNFGIYIGTDVHNIENSIDLITKELDKLKSKPVSEAELRRTKEQVKGALMLSLESMSNRMMRLGSGELYFERYSPIDDIVRNIDAVQQEDMYGVAT